MTPEFPSNLARGITSRDCLVDGRMRPCVFQFTKNRGNGLCEMSVQWLDDEESERIAKSMMRRDSGDPKFGLGFAVMRTSMLDEVKSIECYRGMDYCRVPNESPESFNPYHGHVTIPIGMYSLARQLASELVMRSELYKYDEPLPVG